MNLSDKFLLFWWPLILAAASVLVFWLTNHVTDAPTATIISCILPSAMAIGMTWYAIGHADNYSSGILGAVTLAICMAYLGVVAAVWIADVPLAVTIGVALVGAAVPLYSLYNLIDTWGVDVMTYFGFILIIAVSAIPVVQHYATAPTAGIAVVAWATFIFLVPWLTKKIRVALQS